MGGHADNRAAEVQKSLPVKDAGSYSRSTEGYQDTPNEALPIALLFVAATPAEKSNRSRRPL